MASSGKKKQQKTISEKQQEVDQTLIGPYDILCGRTSNAYNNIGNRRFRVTIRMFLQRYQDLGSRADRKVFIYYLTRLFRNEIGFRFLKKAKNSTGGDGGDYHDIGEIDTRKKIGHALLDQNMKHNKEAAALNGPPPAPPLKPQVPLSSSSSSGIIVRSSNNCSQEEEEEDHVARNPSLTSSSSCSSSLQQQQQQIRRVSDASMSNPRSYRRRRSSVITTTTTTTAPEKKGKKRPCGKANNTGKKAPLPKRVSKLESEICFLLLGLQQQQQQEQNPPDDDSRKAPVKNGDAAAVATPAAAAASHP